MNYSIDEVLQYVREEDVKFVRLAFCDVLGTPKNISIMADELPRALDQGVAFDGSAIFGAMDGAERDLILTPDAGTLVPLPWRPEHGRVVQLFSTIHRSDGTPFIGDTRALLARAIDEAECRGISFRFGSRQEFYLFELDELGRPTKRPCDQAGFMDIAPEDRGENVRREVCLTLERMGIHPESSHHEAGPGQNEIDFRHADALAAADNAMTFQRVVRTIAHRNGLCADFSAKPLDDKPGNGFHIRVAPEPCGDGALEAAAAGLLAHAREMTLFLNPAEGSYRRLGTGRAPGFISWSAENRSQLVKLVSMDGRLRCVELRSPDPSANPYIAFALVIHAAMDGIERGMVLPAGLNEQLAAASSDAHTGFEQLPGDIAAAREAALKSDFINTCIPPEIVSVFCRA